MMKKEILQLNLRYDDMTMTFFSKLFSILTKKSVVIFFIVLFIIQNAILVYPVYFYSKVSLVASYFIFIAPFTSLSLCLAIMKRFHLVNLIKYFVYGYVGSFAVLFFLVLLENLDFAIADKIVDIIFILLSPLAYIVRPIFFLYRWPSDKNLAFAVVVPSIILIMETAVPIFFGALFSTIGYFFRKK